MTIPHDDRFFNDPPPLDTDELDPTHFPADKNVELALLGKIFLDQSLDGLEFLAPSDFYFSDHKTIFQLLREADERGEPLDTYIVANQDERLALTMIDAMNTATDNPYTEAAAYARRVRDLALKRKMGPVLSKVAAMSMNGASVAEVRSALDDLHQMIDSAAESDDAAGAVSPLDVGQVAHGSLGWIDEYASYASGLTASPVEFNRLAGLILGAVSLGRRAYLPMAFGNIHANIFGANIAPSSVYHKSASQAVARDMLYRADMTDLQLANLSTPEGLLAEMETRSTGLILRDEIGMLFDSHNVKYLRELKPLLTDIYDGQPIRRRLSNKEFTVRDPHLNILGATTPDAFYDAVAQRDWRDGFLARWLFVLPVGAPDFDADAAMRTSEHETIAARLAGRLRDIRREPIRAFIFDEGALKRWDAWRKASIRAAYEFGDETINQIVTRNATYALKFALILSALNGPYGRITVEIVETAMALADEYKQTAHRLLQGRQNHGISGAKLQKVFQAIKRGSHPTAREIQQKTGLRADEVNAVLDKLIEVGAVISAQSGRTVRYAHAVEALPVKSWK